MSGSPVIRFRLKQELCDLLEARGPSASAVAKQIVLDDIKRGPIPADLLPAVEETERETALDDETVQEIKDLAEEGVPDALLDEAIEAAEEEKTFNSGVETQVGVGPGVELKIEERPNPFALITPRLGAEPPPKEPKDEPKYPGNVGPSGPTGPPSEEGDEELRGLWKELMRKDPGLAIDIGTFEEFKRRRENGNES